MEEYLQMHSSDSTNASQRHTNSKADLLGSVRFHNVFEPETDEDLKLANEEFHYIGRIPEPPSDTEPMGLGAKEILQTVNFKLPSNSLPKQGFDQDTSSEIDSLFQGHINNMLKTIKKAKANQKQKIPELRGLIPTIIPQAIVENDSKEEENASKNEKLQTIQNEAQLNLLQISKNLPKNSPPPSAPKSTPDYKTLKTSHLNTDKISDQLSLPLVVTVDPPNLEKTIKHNQSANLEAQSQNNDVVSNEIRIMTSSVDLILPSSDDEMSAGATTDRSRLEVVITSIPAAPPTYLATTSDELDEKSNR